jgi:anti-anti-sigma factor
MDYQVSIVPEGINVEMTGRMGSEASELLGSELMQYADRGHRNYIFNIDKISYIGSAGIGVLIALNKHVRPSGGSITIVGVKGHIKELFEMTMMDKVVKIKE